MHRVYTNSTKHSRVGSSPPHGSATVNVVLITLYSIMHCDWLHKLCHYASMHTIVRQVQEQLGLRFTINTYLTFKQEVILSLCFMHPVPVARTLVLLGPFPLPITLFTMNCRQSSSFSVLNVISSILI